MFKKDFILNMIEMLAELVAGILGLIKKGKFEEASQNIEQAYNDLLSKDAAYFNKIPVNELNKTLIQEHNYTHGHLEVLSDLFYAQAELAFAQGKYVDSLPFYQKSLWLLEEVIKATKTFSFDKEAKITLLNNRVMELQKL